MTTCMVTWVEQWLWEKELCTTRAPNKKSTVTSGTETELIGVDNVLSQVLWNNCFMSAQGLPCRTMIHPDNKSATSSENDGRLSSGNGTKNINVRHCFMKDVIKTWQSKIERSSADKMLSDCFTKPLQGGKFIEFHKNIENSQKMNANNHTHNM